MDRKKLTKTLILLIFFILIIHALANKFYWYSSIWYFDMIMHFLGGFWLGLVVIYILRPKNVSLRSILKILFFVFLVGVGWEVFEILVNDVFARNAFSTLDTLSDLFFDLSGGALGILYFLKRIMLQ